jgi:hypothetical protein
VRRHGHPGSGDECGVDWSEVAKPAFDLSGISNPSRWALEDWAADMLPGELFEAADE